MVTVLFYKKWVEFWHLSGIDSDDTVHKGTTTESRGAPPHQGVHQELEGNQSGEGGLPPCLWTVHKRGADAGYELVCAIVVLRGGKWT